MRNIYAVLLWTGMLVVLVSFVVVIASDKFRNGEEEVIEDEKMSVGHSAVENDDEAEEVLRGEMMNEGGPSYHPEVSLPAMMEEEYNGSDLELVRVVRETDTYTEHFITYTSGELTISGILNIPTGEVPESGFPVLFLNHGYIDPSVYTNGRGLRREQDFLAREGFAVLHSDYRNHAASDDDPDSETMLRLGYVEDVINAVMAVRRSDVPELSKDRFGMLGHSMGGGIAQSIMVVRPELINAYVLYAPVSSDARDSFRRWTSRRSETAEQIAELYGLPEDAPAFWDDVSPRMFFDRVTSPVMIFHGTADASCDIAWSRETRDLLASAGAEVELVEYPGEAHEFGPRHTDFMRRTAEFFREEL